MTSAKDEVLIVGATTLETIALQCLAKLLVDRYHPWLATLGADELNDGVLFSNAAPSQAGYFDRSEASLEREKDHRPLSTVFQDGKSGSEICISENLRVRHEDETFSC
jgi:hypothetical protein